MKKVRRNRANAPLEHLFILGSSSPRLAVPPSSLNSSRNGKASLHCYEVKLKGVPPHHLKYHIGGIL